MICARKRTCNNSLRQSRVAFVLDLRLFPSLKEMAWPVSSLPPVRRCSCRGNHKVILGHKLGVPNLRMMLPGLGWMIWLTAEGEEFVIHNLMTFPTPQRSRNGITPE